MSPTCGELKCMPMRLTSTRWPTARVGTIDSLGMRYGLTRNAWMPSAKGRDTATIITSSSSAPEVDDDPFLAATGRLPGLLVTGGGRLDVGRRLGIRGLGLFQCLLVDRLAGDLVVGRGCRLGRGIVQQAALDDLLRPGVAALAHA